MRASRRTVLSWLALVLAAVAGLVALFRPAPLAVDVAAVGRDTLRVTVDEDGVTRLRRRFVVSAPVAGRVLRIEAVAGQAVEAGEALASITPAPSSPLDERTRAGASARVQAAQAALERARSERRRLGVEADQAMRDSERSTALLEAGSVSREVAEVAAVRAQAAKASVSAADAAVREAEFVVSEARSVLAAQATSPSQGTVSVRSPIRGVVLRRLQESETIISPGAPLLEIGHLEDLEIVADILSTDAVRVRVGNAVTITEWGGGHDLHGRVVRIEPSGFTKVSALGVEEQRVNVVVGIDEPESKRAGLGDGFRVGVRITVVERPDVLVVPTAALFRTERQWSVFQVVDGRLHRRVVEIGERGDELAEVAGGLEDQAQVVVYPGESLTDGMRVAPR